MERCSGCGRSPKQPLGPMSGLADGRRPLATAWAWAPSDSGSSANAGNRSDELARMHGYEPGTVEPTTQLLLSHKHPDDRGHVQDLLDRALHSRSSFSGRHRFIDTSGTVHDAMVVADRMYDDTGAVVGTAGYYLDLTSTFVETRQVALDEALPDLFEARAVIEQAKGLLTAVYRVSPDQAFGLLRWRSQETNTKLRLLAKQLIDEIITLPPVSAEVQSAFDHLLLTVHQRIPAEPTA